MKRIICVMLTLIMLVSAVPAAAITASAASMTTTGASITVLKNMLKFRSECYQIDGTKEFRIGYGSICKGEHKDDYDENGVWNGTPHKMNQITADNLLRKTMQEMDKKVNSFASSNGLSLKQSQFDALAVFSYLTGTAWMSGNGSVKTAVKNGADSTELMNAFYGVLNKSYDNSIATDRSKILTNMYFNGIYSNSPSENYKWVRYNANGGDMPVQGEVYKLRNLGDKTYEMYFDASKSVDHPVTPTRKGYKFLGWYYHDGETIGARSTALNSSCKNKELIAVWQKNDVTVDNAIKSEQNVHYTVNPSKLASDVVYKKPDRNAPWTSGDKNLEASEYYKGKPNPTALIEFMAPDGSRWVCTHLDGDWLLLSGKTGSSSGDSSGYGYRTGVNVTNSYVNIREKATIYSKNLGSLKQGDRVYISRTESRDGFLWGHAYPARDTDKDIGWIALMYTNYNTAKDEDQSDRYEGDPSKPANTVIAKATITYPGYVNMRDNPGTGNSKIVGSLAQNDIVNVYEIKTVNGNQWGRTNGGWFCLTYAHLQMLDGSSDVSNPGSADYTFTGKATEDMTVYVDTTTNSNTVGNAPKKGDSVKIITLNSRDNQTWAKISWTYKYKDKDGKEKSTTKYGWVKAGNISQGQGADIKLDPVKFTVVADSVNVRRYGHSGSDVLTKLDKGYEFNVGSIIVHSEEIWGSMQLFDLDGGAPGDNSGWVNLASKYVKRSDRLEADDDDDEPYYDEIATVVGVEKVNVRRHADIKSDIVGQLKLGTTAYVIERDDNWYKLDVDVDNDPDTSSWVSGQYLEIKKGSLDSANRPSSHGTGVVANTYAGLNVRTGPGTAYPIVGTKLLPGTPVKILETKYVGTVRWGRIADNKWVCMDYISMTNEVYDETEEEKPEAPNGGEWVKDYDEIDRTTTTAVYTGTVAENDVKVWANTEHHDEAEIDGEVSNSHVVRTLNGGDPVNIYELITVVEKIDITDETTVPGDDNGATVEKTVTHYWARTNDGYILDPQKNIVLNSLDEKAHTLTGSDTLNVRKGFDADNEPNVKANPSGEVIGKLTKGDVVKVTKLSIVKDKVWGLIEYAVEDDYIEEGWIRLDYMSEGAFYKEEEKEEDDEPSAPNTPAPPADDNYGSIGDTGKKVDGVYRYDGKIKSEVKLRAQASTASDEIRKLKAGEKIYIYETTLVGTMAWGRTDGGWVSLYYVDMTPRDSTNGIDARLVYRPTNIYSDSSRTETVGSYAIQAVIDIYEVVGNMARTELGWVYTGDLL